MTLPGQICFSSGRHSVCGPKLLIAAGKFIQVMCPESGEPLAKVYWIVVSQVASTVELSRI